MCAQYIVCVRSAIVRTCMRVCITLFWLNYDFLISSSISVCVCGADLAGKAACCLWTIRKSSAYQQNWAQLQIPEKTDRQEQMLGMKRERFPTFWTCLHLALWWVRLLKCGSFNCVNMQPTQNYSWNCKAAVHSKRFSLWLNSCVNISLLLISFIHTLTHSENYSCSAFSVLFAATMHPCMQAVIHTADRLHLWLYYYFFLVPLWHLFPAPPMWPSKTGRIFLKAEIDTCVFRPFVLQCFL